MSDQDEEKKTPARVVPKTSQAPPPPSPIRGVGYSRPRNTPARFEYWNLVPAVTIDQFTNLALGCDPGTELVGKEKERCTDLLVLIRAHQANHTLPNPVDPWNANPMYKAEELIAWAELVGYRNEDWKPIKSEPTDDIDDDLEDNIHTRRRNEVLGAAVEMLEFSVPIDQQTVLNFMRKTPDKYPACFQRTVEDKTLIKSITRAGGDVFDHLQYRDALASADRTDSADKG